MKDNNKAKILTIGIAVLMIVIICGISFVLYGIKQKESNQTGNKLQSDIIDYANNTQNQSVQAEDIIVKDKENEKNKELDMSEEAVKEAPVIVEQKENNEAETIMEEAVKEQNSSQKTTAKWQKESKENLSTVEVDLSRQMAEMKGYWEAGNMAAIEDLAYLPRYRAASEKLSGTTKYYYFGDTDGSNRPNGKGLAMYADNQYYYGEWNNGVRSGSGMWIKYYVYDQNTKAVDSLYLQHSYSGNWSNDLPNGSGTEHYDFIEENMEQEVGYNRNFIGEFKNGLYHGEIYITNYYNNGNIKEWNGTAQNGVWQPMGEKDKNGQYPIIVEVTNKENYQWLSEKKNVNQGVNGLISAAKQ